MATKIKTVERVIPMCYAYTTPEIHRHNGWVKIGYTEKQDVTNRIKQQAHTLDTVTEEQWRGNAIFEDGSGDIFHDTDFHRYLQKQGVERIPDTEWFHLDGAHSFQQFNAFRQNRGVLKSEGVIPYKLRAEQQKAVDVTVEAFRIRPITGQFLWNAKPRFGKTLTTYDFAKTVGAKNILILTGRPAIANSWYEDYEKFLGTQSGYVFVSEVSTLKGKKNVLTRMDYIHKLHENPDLKCIEFVSLQDLKGSRHGGGKFDKLDEVYDQNWDLLVLDEAHEGVDTTKTSVALDNIHHGFVLNLSGTPFKQLANDKFEEKEIFNWTYADEQRAKRDWNSDAENPYASLPTLNLFTYQMSEIIKDEISQGIDLNGETEEYTFDLNEFFETKGGKFVHDKDVNRFLDALTVQTRFPFSTSELREELKHTFWLLNRVDSAKALAQKLNKHPIFKDYKVIVAAGDGKTADEDSDKYNTESNMKSYDKVRHAIDKYDKTITLSVGQLTTGVTIPEWTGVMMLSNMKSPALYMQAAFRAQNPYKFKKNGQLFRKEKAYVFDFDPQRTLDLYGEFANGLSTTTSDGRGTTDQHKQNIRELLNFFPVLGEDVNGEMVELDAEKVMSIPKKIRAEEVINRGFMSNFLFQNITNLFRAPKVVKEILEKFDAVSEKEVPITPETADELDINDKGEVEIPEEKVEENANYLFGDKIYSKVEEDFINAYEEEQSKSKEKSQADIDVESITKLITQNVINPLVKTAKDNYGKELSTSSQKRIERKITGEVTHKVEKAIRQNEIDKYQLEREKEQKLEGAKNTVEKKEIEKLYQQKEKEHEVQAQKNIQETIKESVQEAGKTVARTIETEKKEKESESIQGTIRDHLRGFSRTIPSFLMAYGNDFTTLANFDKIVPADTFEEVTSITLDQFRFLRDGGDYVDEETGETRHFKGDIFDPVVFDDSVRGFLIKKEKLSNYFDQKIKRDIFDYIPPQKNNQIFTPKWVVKKMVDELEENDPGCFDDPNKTFIDLYMKSGLYPAEIVKRLFQSERMKEIFPDKDERLKHIFEKQVFGLAPTEIIYKIAVNFILGFDYEGKIKNHNFRKVDSLELVKEGKLEEKLDELFI
ncbi:DEAD/DEAH box helicase family protein [Dubosiella newyorkensis]|uniref:DEAD/DEAH box helicase family protein n=2 Tax=Dubosiella newyorkensis TaxID=1862672 RepID=UPI00272C9633|nr:DEAD/DEAH box helicase family protein [Dubosiella newyorkensis]